ncbi:MAG TPA: MFS transporter [Streptosporangiaceae bacterium]|nr:MFS transporter [Streptosporangiaceae bacterium]
MFNALRVRDFLLLWSGGLISSIGSWMLIVAVPAHVLLATGSLRDSGLTLAAQYAPLLVLGPFAGVCADRCDRRRLMIATDVVRAGAVAAMLAGLWPGRLWIIFFALVTESGAGVLFAPASQARTPEIVGTGPLLASANSLYAATDGVVRLIGGPLGGVLLIWAGIRWLIVVDAVSYLISAGAIALTSPAAGARAHAVGQAPVAALLRDLAGGLRALRDQRVAWALVPVTAIFLAANASLSAVLIAFGVRRLGGTADTGILLSCLGAGFLVGAPVLRALLDRVQPRLLLAITLTGTAMGYFVLFTSGGLTSALPAAVLIGMFGSMSQVIPLTTVQRAVEGSVLGRVCAVFLTCEAAATLIGSAAGPLLAQAAQFTRLATVASVATLGAAALALLTVPSTGRAEARRRLHAE